MAVVRTSGEVVETVDAVVTRVEQDPKVINVETTKVVVGGYGRRVYTADIENRIAAVNALKDRLAAAEANIEDLREIAVDELPAEITRLDEERDTLEQYVFDLEEAIAAQLEIPEVTAVDELNVTLSTYGTELEWSKVPFAAYYRLYLDGEVIVDAISTTSYTYAVPLGLGLHTFQVEAYSGSDNPSNKASNYVDFSLDPITLGVELGLENTVLSWTDSRFVVGYRIEHNGVVIEDNTKATTYTYKMLSNGLHTFTLYPITASGEEGDAVSTQVTVSVPLHPVLDITYNGEYIIMNWDESNSTYPIRHYIISHDNTVNASKTTTYATKVDWKTNDLSVQAVDIVGNTSALVSVTSVITEPDMTEITSEVVDNNVLLYWSTRKGTLPIQEVEIRKGDVYDTATVIGYRVGTFTTLFETLEGFYTYWFTPKDTAGNTGEILSTTAYMNEPPDYVLNRQWYSDFSGTKVNALLDGTRLIMGINVNETYEEHYLDNGFASMNDQVEQGYDYYLQPNLLTASYEEIFDYESILTIPTGVSVTLSRDTVGTVNTQINIHVSADGLTWTTFSDSSKALATGFRYIKVEIITTSDDVGFTTINQIEVKLDSKLRSDGGKGFAYASDTNGTVVPFGKSFADVTSLTVTAGGTAPIVAIYDFEDVGNPTDFSVYLYDTNGVRVDGNFSWAAKGY